MDLAHFEIIVNAMLAWSAEPKAPKKTPGRAIEPAWPRDELDDDDEDEALVDDDADADDAPIAALRSWPRSGDTAAVELDEAGLPEPEQAD